MSNKIVKTQEKEKTTPSQRGKGKKKGDGNSDTTNKRAAISVRKRLDSKNLNDNDQEQVDKIIATVKSKGELAVLLRRCLATMFKNELGVKVQFIPIHFIAFVLNSYAELPYIFDLILVVGGGPQPVYHHAGQFRQSQMERSYPNCSSATAQVFSGCNCQKLSRV